VTKVNAYWEQIVYRELIMFSLRFLQWRKLIIAIFL